MCCANSARNCKFLVAVGACAINGGLPAQRNRFDVGDILKKVYSDSAGRALARSQRPGTAAAARQGLSDPRSGADRLFHPRLPALRRRLVEIPDRPDRRAHAAPRLSAVSISTEGLTMPSLETAASPEKLRRVAIDPVTRVEGHGKVTLLLDDDNQRASGPAAYRRISRLRSLHRGPALSGRFR